MKPLLWLYKNCRQTPPSALFGVRDLYQVWTNSRLQHSVLEAGYDEYSLLDLYSGFFLLLVPYSENLLLDRVASSSKKTQIFQNILFLDTDNKVFWFISFFLVKYLCKSAICVHLASCCFHFLWECQHFRTSPSPMLRISQRYQCLNFKTDSIAKIDSPIIMMIGAKNENQHQKMAFTDYSKLLVNKENFHYPTRNYSSNE